MNNIMREIKLNKVRTRLSELERYRTTNLLNKKTFEKEKEFLELTSEYYSLVNPSELDTVRETLFKNSLKKRRKE